MYHLDILLSPNFLGFNEIAELLALSVLSKEYYTFIKNNDVSIGYWRSMCTSMVGYGLYCPYHVPNFKKFFFDELWNNRYKWTESVEKKNFKIRVAIRFRPGPKSDNKISLPLHQFLKVRRMQMEKNQDQIFVGDKVPANYEDALLGTIMINPVMLPDSKQIVDRSVATSCILRGGKDPFTNSRLTAEMLISLPELAAEIVEFKKRQREYDVSVNVDDAKMLVEGSVVDSKVLEALVSLEQLMCASHRATVDTLFNNTSHAEDNNFVAEDDNAVLAAAPEENLPIIENDENNLNYMPSNINSDRSSEDVELKSSKDGKIMEESVEGSRWRKGTGETPRLIDVSKSKSVVVMNIPGTGMKPFYFNQVYPDEEKQACVYNESAKDLVISAINGLNGCLICYGQTGSGKTHTMFGPDASMFRNTSEFDEDMMEWKHDRAVGLIIRAVGEVLRAKKVFDKSSDLSMVVTVQYAEIYNDKVTDLISGKALSVRRANGELVGATSTVIDSMESVINLLSIGHSNKHFAATAMNDRSSRAHTVFVMQLSQYKNTHQFDAAGLLVQEQALHLKSQLYLVDLAGSERVKKSKVAGSQLREAMAINSSLLVLGKVISRLSRSEIHIPFYESQLTTLLKGAFGGNSRTCVIVTCRSDDVHFGDETLQSIRFGEQCSMITNNAVQTAAISYNEVMEKLDYSIRSVSHQLDELEKRGKSSLPSFCTLKAKLYELKRQKENLMSNLNSNNISVVNL